MRAIAAVACAIAFAAACDGRPTAGPTGPTGPTVDVPVSGRVLDFGTNAGVPNVGVVLGDSTTVTDANGSYRMTVPSIGSFVAVVDGRYVGGTRVNGPDYPGDLFVNWGRCIGRYGTVTDARTLRPIAGASVAVGSYRVVTDVDGWYRADRACVGDISGGTGSGAIRASHPEYVETVVNGFSRTIDEVLRLDIELKPR